MKLEDYLKSRRLELGLTLNDVAERVGVASSTVSRWEQGDIKNMKRNRVTKYAEALQIDPSVIMGWDEPVDLKKTAETIRASVELSDSEKEMISNLRLLDDDMRKSFADRVRQYADAIRNLNDAKEKIKKLNLNFEVMELDDLKNKTEE